MKKILMCRPNQFDVSYEINPWMKSNIGMVNKKLALEQWVFLYENIRSVAQVELIENQPSNLPDLVFTANAGFVMNNIAFVADFNKKERMPESELFKKTFKNLNFDVDDYFTQNNISFEGAGDCLYDPSRKNLFLSYGFRTNKLAIKYLDLYLKKIDQDINIVQLHLINPSFYHLDTCFCVLDNGLILYYPGAFDEESLQKIQSSSEKLLEVNKKDAELFSCNAVNIGEVLFLNDVTKETEKKLKQQNLNVIKTPMTEFMKSGGAAKCLTLDLSVRN